MTAFLFGIFGNLPKLDNIKVRPSSGEGQKTHNTLEKVKSIVPRLFIIRNSHIFFE